MTRSLLAVRSRVIAVAVLTATLWCSQPLSAGYFYGSMYANDAIYPNDVLHANGSGSYLFFNTNWLSNTFLDLAYGIVGWDSNYDYGGGYGSHQAQSVFDDGQFAVMQGDGNFVLYDNDVVLTMEWATNTEGNSGAFISMQDDGNLVVYSSGNSPLWSIY